jgi:hypothetical protein
MKRLSLFGLMGLCLLPLGGVAADALYLNTGTVNTPQVDAVTFINKGLFQASSSIPYETQDTLTFTNTVGTFAGSGTMVGSPGFRFNTDSSVNGMRTMASSFFNDNGAVVQAQESPLFFLFCETAPIGPSHLIVWATNIVVKSGSSGAPKASLIVGANGEMQLTGKSVDVSRSGLEVLPVWDEPQGSGNGPTNFIPDIAIYDLYWGRTNFSMDFPLFSGSLWNGTVARAQGAPFPDVLPFGGGGFAIANPVADSYINPLPNSTGTITVTNKDGSTTDITFPTNIAKGAIFVGPSLGTTVSMGFIGPAINGLDVASVLLSVQVTNVVTAQSEPAYIFVQDQLGSGGTTGILASVIGCPPSTFRPANYYMDRFPNGVGPRGNHGFPETNFFTSSGATFTNVLMDTVSNSVVLSGEFSAYGAFADNAVTRPPPVANGTVTNIPGRIHITADKLDLTRTRLRGEGEIVIQTSNLISSSNAVVDCENLSFNLTSTNGNLLVQNLSKDTSTRFRGSILLWSATWSNTATLILTNYSIDSNNVATLSPVTNGITIAYHTLMVDAVSLGAFALPVSVFGFTGHSTNVVISDNMSVVESLLVDGKSLTMNGNVTIPGIVPVVNPIVGAPPPGTPLQDWRASNAPTLLYLTNHGNFRIANEAHFGDDRATPYSAFVNTGTVSAASITLNSTYFENRGSMTTAGQLLMQFGSGILQNGSSSSGGDSQFLAGNLKFSQYRMTVNGGLYLRVTNSLYDAGAGSGNSFTIQNGFNLQSKPPTGDLLGTSFESAAPAVPSVEIDHTWAGADRGATAAGYLNNTALGGLRLSSKSPDPFFYFSGTGAQNGLYVDLLDLSALGTNYLNQIAIDPSLMIYFAAATLGFTPPPTNGVPLQPEEYLNGQFGGHLRWVSSFAGPNSSVAVISNGVSILVNRALRDSLIIDSNGNGIPNGQDPYPFDVRPIAKLAVAQQPLTTALVSWNAVAHKPYWVQAATNSSAPSWQTVLYFTNNASTNGTITVQVPVPPGSVRQFYRVGTTQ